MLYDILSCIFTQADKVIAMAAATLEKPKKAKGAKKTPGKAAPKRAAAKKNASNAGVLSPAKTVQMNVRIDAALKKQGDRAFERIGSSPSEMVRALWRYASRHANDPETLRHLMEELEGESEAQDVILEPTRRGWEIMEEAYHALGITPAPLPEDDEERLAYYDELKEEAWLDRQRERGLR